MRLEMAPFGVHVTTLCPGSFRTDGQAVPWSARNVNIADYDSLFDPIREARQAVSGKQLGNPQKLAAAVLTLIESDNPPPQLLLGSDALNMSRRGSSA